MEPPQVMELEPAMAAQARRKFYGDKRFSDFTVICHGTEYHVHRVLVATQSKWFEACCTAPFKEAAEKTVTLHEDDPVAVEKMFQFFYQGYYITTFICTPHGIKEKGPSMDVQLHAYVYAVAEKYDCPGLKQYALNRFKGEVEYGDDLSFIKGAVFAVYQQVELPESDRTLKTVVLEAWVSRRKIVYVESELRQLLKDVPEFAEDLAMEHLRPPSLTPARA